MMTPAEKLAKKNPRRTRKPSEPLPNAAFTCHCAALRNSLNLSVRAVSDALEMSVAGYWRIEKGGEVLLSTARRIAAFYGRKIDELWEPLK